MSDQQIGRSSRRRDWTAGFLVDALLRVLGHHDDIVLSLTISPTEVVIDGCELIGGPEYGRVGPSFRRSHPIGWPATEQPLDGGGAA